MGNQAINMLGKRVGCYTVTARVRRPTDDPQHSRASWRVRCECGYTKVVFGQNLLRYPLIKCTHVPAGHKVVGPEAVAALSALSRVDGKEFRQGRFEWCGPMRDLAEAALALRACEATTETEVQTEPRESVGTRLKGSRARRRA